VQHRNINEQLLGVGVSQDVSLVVPLATLEIHTETVSTGFWGLGDHFGGESVLEHELEVNSIDSESVGSCIVLLGTGEEGLREEETRDPVALGIAIVDPVHQEIASLVAIFDPR